MSTRYDVAIVGYGPVGQALATLLGRRGRSVVVFDKQPGLYPLPRACHIDHEGMRILQAMGIADEVAAAIVPAREYLMLRSDLSVISDLPRVWETPSGWEPSYHFYQPDVEGLFDAAAKATPGVAVRQATAVHTVREESDGVVLTVGDDGEEVRARYVIGADGANSLVRTQAGIGREDLGFEATWVVVDVEIAEGAPALNVPDTGQVLDPAQPRHMAWLGGRHYRWEFMIVDGADPAEASLPENVWPKLSQWVDPATSTLLRSTAYTFGSLVAETFRAGRVLLAGDAAHLMPPFMGQGMVSGLRDAASLAWILDLVLTGRADEGFLDAYTETRRPHVLAYIAESVRVGQMVCETDPERARVRDAELEAQTQSPPPFQPLAGSLYLRGPLAGTIAVQPRVGGRLLDDVLGPAFTVLTVDGSDLAGLNAGGQGAIGALGLVTAVLAEGEGPGIHTPDDDRFANWLSAADATWTLVRPDGYVYAAGRGADALGGALAALRRTVAVAA